ncbi:hypothetical protein EYF80_051781 [Liparis tanakae]|uniref:Uncharacterized protein n=1 Tax=Liparis tanakae TaxID=230148 RepID=A0A4Z2FAT7_9TELE|nr:hypothetical protein EYF80_051781 [Liparis tanakae]
MATAGEPGGVWTPSSGEQQPRHSGATLGGTGTGTGTGRAAQHRQQEEEEEEEDPVRDAL